MRKKEREPKQLKNKPWVDRWPGRLRVTDVVLPDPDARREEPPRERREFL